MCCAKRSMSTSLVFVTCHSSVRQSNCPVCKLHLFCVTKSQRYVCEDWSEFLEKSVPWACESYVLARTDQSDWWHDVLNIWCRVFQRMTIALLTSNTQSQFQAKASKMFLRDLKIWCYENLVVEKSVGVCDGYWIQALQSLRPLL